MKKQQLYLVTLLCFVLPHSFNRLNAQPIYCVNDVPFENGLVKNSYYSYCDDMTRYIPYGDTISHPTLILNIAVINLGDNEGNPLFLDNQTMNLGLLQYYTNQFWNPRLRENELPPTLPNPLNETEVGSARILFRITQYIPHIIPYPSINENGYESIGSAIAQDIRNTYNLENELIWVMGMGVSNGGKGYGFALREHNAFFTCSTTDTANTFDATILHELGHALGLLHTFEGDNIDDTPGSLPGLTFNEFKSCTPAPGTCPNNLMGYNGGFYLSPKQIGYIRRGLENDVYGTSSEYKPMTKFLANCKKLYDIPLSIDSDVTWSKAMVISRDVIVKSGSKLTINCRVNMAQHTKLIVENGATLIVDGGVITNECGYFWKGIELQGNSSVNQLSSAPDRPAHLILKNALLENAVCAVTTWNPEQWAETGGYICATNSTFRNNRKDVEFMSYPLKETSLFVNCRFITENDMPEASTFEGRSHVTLYDTYGTRFFNCTFENSSNQIEFASQLGTGIYSLNANFSVLGGSTEFNNLETGVHATGIQNTRNYNVLGATFNKNDIGIRNSATHNAVIRDNRMYLNSNQANSGFQTGIYVENSKGFSIANNMITQDNAATNKFTIGTYANNLLEPRNEVYNNNISKVSIANLALGNNTGSTGANQGLKYKCNDMSDNRFDIAAMWGNGISQIQNEINTDQQTGVITMIPASNTFSTNPDVLEGHIFNRATASFPTLINYIHPDPASTSLILEPVYFTPNKVNNIGILKNYDKQIDCPSEPLGLIQGGTIAQRSAIFYEHKPMFDDARYTYKILIDGGNTDTLRYRINYAYPWETWVLRTELLNSSPFLSDRVLWSAAQNTAVLPNPVLLEILMANPQTARMDSLLEWLASEPRSFEEYMLDAIRGNFNVQTLKDELESKINYHGRYLHLAARELMYIYENDSTLVNEDSLMMWRFRLSPSENQEWQAGKTFATRDYVSARAQLEAATNFEEYERSGLTNLYSQLLMIDTLRMLSGDTIRIERLDTAAQLILQQFAESGTEAGAVQARNLLSFFYDYRYPLVYPNMNTPKKATKTTNSAGGKTTFTEVKVYPNPAKDFVIIEWKERDGFRPERVQFVSATGAVLWQSAVRSGAGSIVCPVTGIARGTIYYNLTDSSGKVLSNGSILLN